MELKQYRTKADHVPEGEEAQTCEAVRYMHGTPGAPLLWEGDTPPTIGGYPFPPVGMGDWVVHYEGIGVCVYTDAEFNELYEPVE